MHALAQTVETLVAALACSVFAHFGVALKEPCPKAAPRILISSPAAVRPERPGTRAAFPQDVRRI